MISPIKRSRSSVICAGRGCIFCSQPSFVVSNTHAHRQLDCSRGTHDWATHFFLHYAQAACVRPEIEPRASPPSSAPHTATRASSRPAPACPGFAATPSPPRSTAAHSPTRQPSRPPRAPAGPPLASHSASARRDAMAGEWSLHGDDFEGAGVRHRRCGRATHLRRSAGAHHDPPVRRGRRRRALHLLHVPGDEQPLRLDDCRRAGAHAQARAREPGGAHLLLRRGFGLQRGRDHLPVRGVEVRLVPRADAR